MFFLRSYKKGSAKSGTTDIQTWDNFPGFDEFKSVCEANGEGKYVLFERGKGIRGMRKVNEYFIEAKTAHNETNLNDLLVFAAEEFGLETDTLLSVKQKMPIGNMSDDELMNVLDQMTKGAEGQGTLGRDVKAVMGELKNRVVTNPATTAIKEAESSPLKKLGFGAGMLVGGLGGVAATAVYYRQQISEMETRLAAMESSMKETETELRKETDEIKRKQKAEEAVRQYDANMNLDTAFLSAFNRKHPAREF
tara:strand:+ start:544 stop:1296 length:753 start_codon:yes stop_codon:yes gene_type:complete